MQDKSKEDKQKVTLYLPPELHRKLKITAAVDSGTMTDIAQRAIVFYLAHPEVVEQYEQAYGQAHRVFSCPECSTQVVFRDNEMVSLNPYPGLDLESSLCVDSDPVGIDPQGEGELVPC